MEERDHFKNSQGQRLVGRFRENDIRAKAGSDAGDLQTAQRLLAHESAATTQRRYRRRVAKVILLK